MDRTPPADPQRLRELIDIIVRPGTGALVPTEAEVRLIREAGAASGRIGKDTVTSPGELRRILDAARRCAALPLLVSVNQESGRLDAVDWPAVAQLPGSMALGSADSEHLAERAGAAVAAQLRAVGLTWNLAPVVDLASWPSASAVGTRSFGSDPQRAAALAAAWVRGCQGGGVAATAKHFPGLGGIRCDPHHQAPVVDRLAPGALLPFRKVVEAGVASVMVGSHTVLELDDRPALASARVIALLRDEVGFDGVVVSENLSIPAVHGPLGGIAQAAVAAVAAGVDVVMLDSEVSRGHQNFAQRAAAVRRREHVAQALVTAVECGQIPLSRIAEAAGRMTALHRRFGLGAEDVLPPWERANHTAQEVARQVAESSVAVVRGSHLLPLTSWDALAVVRVPDTRQRRADSARLSPDAMLAALSPHRRVLPQAPGDALPRGVDTVVVYGYDTSTMDGPCSAAAVEAARWVGRGRTVVQVAVGDPDDLVGSTADVLVAAFSPHRASAQAAAAAVLDHGQARGSVPVEKAAW